MVMQRRAAFGLAVGLVLLTSIVILWLNTAAGLIGIEDDDPANLLYVGVIAIIGIGAVITRMRPRGMAYVLATTALVQALVGAIALTLPNTASPEEIVSVHGAFVLLFSAAAFLFRYAGWQDPRLRGPGMSESREDTVE